MPRPAPLSSSATWWPSTLWQTTTLELRRPGERLLVDPGISLWEIEEVIAASSDPVAHVVVTHADWDHVMALGHLPQAIVVAAAGADERIRSGEVRESVERETTEFYVEAAHLDGLRVDRPLELPAEVDLGSWHAVCLAAPGHTEDGMAVWLPEDGLLVVGDHLSPLEIPWAYSSIASLRDTVATLAEVIGRERPSRVVVGHGPPLTADHALRIAEEDVRYLDAVLAAAAGGDLEAGGRISPPARIGSPGDALAHAANLRLASEQAGGARPAREG